MHAYCEHFIQLMDQVIATPDHNPTKQPGDNSNAQAIKKKLIDLKQQQMSIANLLDQIRMFIVESLREMRSPLNDDMPGGYPSSVSPLTESHLWKMVSYINQGRHITRGELCSIQSPHVDKQQAVLLMGSGENGLSNVQLYKQCVRAFAEVDSLIKNLINEKANVAEYTNHYGIVVRLDGMSIQKQLQELMIFRTYVKARAERIAQYVPQDQIEKMTASISEKEILTSRKLGFFNAHFVVKPKMRRCMKLSSTDEEVAPDKSAIELT